METTISLDRKAIEKILIDDLVEFYGYHPTTIRRHMEDEKSFVATIREMAMLTVKEFARFGDIKLNITSTRLSKHQIKVVIDSELSQDKLNDFIIKNTKRTKLDGGIFNGATAVDVAMLEFFGWLRWRDKYIFNRQAYNTINKTMSEFVKNDKVNVQTSYRGSTLAVPKEILYGNRWNVIEYFEEAERQGWIKMENPAHDNMDVTCWGNY